MFSKSPRGTCMINSATTIVSPYICSERYTKAQSLSGYGSIQIIWAQVLLAMIKEGEETLTPSGRIMSEDERKGGESSLTPERVVYPRGGVGMWILSFLRIFMVDVISRRVWEGMLPILEATWGLWGVPRKCGQFWCLCWAMVNMGVKPGSCVCVCLLFL